MRLAPPLVALLLGVLTTSARQWEMLAGHLPRTPDWGAYRFAPSGNEWRMRRWSAAGADRYALRRTYTADDRIDPATDVRTAFVDIGIPPQIDLSQPAQGFRGWVGWSAASWGWPMRHTSVDSFGRRRILLGGFVVDSLAYTPVWLALLYAIRRPVAFVIYKMRRPEWECRRCRYDLRGIPEDAPCPECGRERSQA